MCSKRLDIFLYKHKIYISNIIQYLLEEKLKKNFFYSSKTDQNKGFSNHLPKINVLVSLYMRQDSKENLGEKKKQFPEALLGDYIEHLKHKCIYFMSPIYFLHLHNSTLQLKISTFTYNFT